MIHNCVNEKGDHWAANHNGYGEVLVQLQEGMEQVRLRLTVEQARDMANKILQLADIAQTQDSLEVALEKYKQNKDEQ